MVWCGAATKRRAAAGRRRPRPGRGGRPARRSAPAGWCSRRAPGRRRSAAPLGLRIPVEPQRGQICHLRLPGVDTGRWPVINAFRGHYMVCLARGPRGGRRDPRDRRRLPAADHARGHHGGARRGAARGTGAGGREPPRGPRRPAAGEPRRPAAARRGTGRRASPAGDRPRPVRPAARALQRQADRRDRDGRRRRAPTSPRSRSAASPDRTAGQAAGGVSGRSG